MVTISTTNSSYWELLGCGVLVFKDSECLRTLKNWNKLTTFSSWSSEQPGWDSRSWRRYLLSSVKEQGISPQPRDWANFCFKNANFAITGVSFICSSLTTLRIHCISNSYCNFGIVSASPRESFSFGKRGFCAGHIRAECSRHQSQSF